MSTNCPSELAAVASGSTLGNGPTVEVVWKDGAASFACRSGEPLLLGGLAAGLSLPYECATGNCGSCKARLATGEVDPGWLQAPGRESARRNDEILLCQARAITDCQVVLAQQTRAAPWPVPTHCRARVERSGMLTHDVILLQVRLDRPLKFRPGQFFLLSAPDVMGFRAYSMVNVSHGDALLEFIVKRKPGGALSDVLFSKQLHEVEFDAFGPLGRACFDPGTMRDLYCFAGGTGIAGLMSILSSAAVTGHFERFGAEVYFGVRRSVDAFFLDRLSELVDRHPDAIRVTVALSDEAVPYVLSSRHRSLRFIEGMLHDVIANHPPQLADEPSVFVGGPPAAVDSVTRVALLNLKVPATRMHFDRFG